MQKFPLSPGENHPQALACPNCGFDGGLHIDSVSVAARREDQQPVSIAVDAITGHVSHPRTGERIDVPTGPAVGEGRRHRIVLHGWCECCEPGRFVIVFTQHKGTTLVEVLAQQWVAL